MSSFKLPRVLSWPLTIRRGEAQLKATQVIVFDDPASHLIEFAAEFLGPTENAYFSTLRFARRQQSYLLGRYAAKLALRDLLGEPDLRAIEIVRGVFEQPIVHCARSHRWCVTISHADSLAVALAFPTGHPMALDIEPIDLTRYETILSQLSNQETQWIEVSAEHKLQLATALWTAKEALSKVLCTGLMSPVQIYNLSEFNAISSGYWEGLFQNFGQYKTITWIGSAHVMSIVLPKKSIIVNEREILEAFLTIWGLLDQG
jgi:4'-phosphopantetheinyl transferase